MPSTEPSSSAVFAPLFSRSAIAPGDTWRNVGPGATPFLGDAFADIPSHVAPGVDRAARRPESLPCLEPGAEARRARKLIAKTDDLWTQAVDRADALSALCDPETRIMAEANDAIIAQLREQLAAKDVELEQAQAHFDEFTASSQELEEELEAELKRHEERNAELEAWKEQHEAEEGKLKERAKRAERDAAAASEQLEAL